MPTVVRMTAILTPGIGGMKWDSQKMNWGKTKKAWRMIILPQASINFFWRRIVREEKLPRRNQRFRMNIQGRPIKMTRAYMK